MYASSINSRYIDEIVEAMKDGQLIIYPTDTLYAIGCDALNNRAIERLCRIKGLNPEKQSLSIVCADISQASEYARIDNKAFKVLKDYLPGPYTFILPAATTLPKVFKGRKTVGVRIPDNDIARAIAEAMGNPVLTTSINVDVRAQEEYVDPISIAMHYEGSVDVMVDGGYGDLIPSTIVDLLDSGAPEVLREGKAPFE
jgi:tRNA threonylcarbamoyl adenosine modification protein (Sua5/YciO/YrdC/YwlC family)